MNVEFTQAASRDQFLARIEAMNEGVSNGLYLDNTLALSSNKEAFLWLRKGINPIISCDLSSSYRSAAVANSLFAYCRANRDFLTPDLIDRKIFPIFEALHSTSKVANISALIAPPQPNPAPAPLPPASPAAVSLNEGEVALAKRQLAYDISFLSYELLCSLSKQLKAGGSFTFSPLGLMEIVSVLVKGANEEARQRLVEKLGLGHVRLDLVDQELKKKRYELKQQHVVVSTGFVGVRGLRTQEVKEFTDRVLQSGTLVTFPKIQSARRTLNEEFGKLIGKASFEMLPTIHSNCVADLVSLSPTFAQAPSEKVEQRLFTFSNGKNVKTDYYAFTDVKVLEEEKFKMVVLPYATKEGQQPLVKVIFWPNRDATLGELYPKLDGDFIKSCQEKLNRSPSQSVTLFVPKQTFSFKRTNLLDLVNEHLPKAVITLAKEKLGSLVQQVELQESVPEMAQGALQAAQAAGRLDIDRTFYYFIKSGDDIILQGRADDPLAFGVSTLS